MASVLVSLTFCRAASTSGAPVGGLRGQHRQFRAEPEGAGSGGQRLPIHELSLGIEKPVVVPAGQEVQTALLFGEGQARARPCICSTSTPLGRPLHPFRRSAKRIVSTLGRARCATLARVATTRRRLEHFLTTDLLSAD